ncbi:MAG: MFS transporter [Verrucomicrobia bacterium]|jgi:MFS family permease|nr:MFS transporter [Verrucomicrobiota bacterium]
MNNRHDKMLFWGCFIALITTSTAFITRAILVNTVWPVEFDLDKVQAQELFGAGIWPFAISIILFSLVIDKVGYKAAMFFSSICYAAYAGLALAAYGVVHAAGLEGQALMDAQQRAWGFLYAGSVILGLGNGTVEAFINPVVATLFSKEKTKWLNMLHAGWPAGLVLGGVITILLSSAVERDWRIVVYLLAIPAVIYLIMLVPLKFPVQERVASGTSYREMLAEFGVIGAAIAGYLVCKQLGLVFGWSNGVTYGLLAAAVIAYGAYCRSIGRPLLIVLCLIMMPLATTELGTDGAITGLMEDPMKAAGHNPAWVLVYTSAIMMVLRFFAGPLVKVLTPLGLLAACAALAIVGLNLLAVAAGMAFIFFAATLYGVGKTYFWPTMLGVVSEQCPKGGALTLNAIAGIGMLTVGIIGGPLIGRMQEASAERAIEAQVPGVYAQVSVESSYFLGRYRAVDHTALGSLPPEQQTQIQNLDKKAKQGALAKISVFPAFMLACYLGLILYFKSRGGYKPVQLAVSGEGGGH